MRKLLFIIFNSLLVLNISFSYAQTISLFNGEDLDGWHVDVPEMDDNPNECLLNRYFKIICSKNNL